MERTIAQERLNTWTHAAGLVLSVVGSMLLIARAILHGDAWRVAGCAIYAASLIGVFAASTLSHAFRDAARRRMFRILDQAIIYLLIVGTYTPFALAFLRTGWWLGLLIAMWAVALVGFVSKVLYAHRVDSVSVAIYLALGWTPIIAGWPLTGLVPARALWWMLIGGLCYTLGAVFLLLDRRVEHFHAVWHVLVIAGSGWHFLAIYQYVAAA